MAIVHSMDFGGEGGGKTFPSGARLARCEEPKTPKNKRGENESIQSGITHPAGNEPIPYPTSSVSLPLILNRPKIYADTHIVMIYGI
jgi:hypothetical protein